LEVASSFLVFLWNSLGEDFFLSFQNSPSLSQEVANNWCSIEEVESISSSLKVPQESCDSCPDWSLSCEVIETSSDAWFSDSDSYLSNGDSHFSDSNSIPEVYYDYHYFSE
jgi:hypothetical protein